MLVAIPKPNCQGKMSEDTQTRKEILEYNKNAAVNIIGLNYQPGSEGKARPSTWLC